MKKMEINQRNFNRHRCCALVSFGKHQQNAIVVDVSKFGLRMVTAPGTPFEQNIEISMVGPKTHHGSIPGRIVWVRQESRTSQREFGVELLEQSDWIDDIIAEVTQPMSEDKIAMTLATA
jgi:PilZ domain